MTREQKKRTNSKVPEVREAFVVTIDGPAGVGKSTVAKELAKRLGLTYLDTGATYRALAYAALEKGLHPLADANELVRMARNLPLQLDPEPSGGLRVTLEGVDITKAIRTEEVSEAAAQVSQNPKVRDAMVKLQRRLAKGRGVVVEGRDAGSVIFPKAAYKFFLDADPTIRAMRRQRELSHLYGARTPLAQVQEQLHFRDGLDRKRRVGPLIKPEGATSVDTSHLSIAQVVQAMMEQVNASRKSAQRA